MSQYIFTTQNEIPYRLQLYSKNIKDVLIEISWTYNFFNCKKIAKSKKTCESYILISCKYSPTKSPLELLKHLPVKKITIWKRLTGCVVIQQEIINVGNSLELDFLQDKGTISWIKTWIKQQKCTACGRIYSHTHTCHYNRASFYYNKIASSRTYWESITFQPIGEHDNTHKLFLIYDIETYTLAEKEGTVLVPLLLCFSIFGDKHLVNIAEKEISKDKTIQVRNQCYMWMSKEKNFISTKFRLLRNNILLELTNYFLKHILTKENTEILDDFVKQHNLESIFDININEEKNLILSLKIKAVFIEFYVIGHNIQSFDEILLATQILQHDNFQISPLLTFDRNFMPRQGKILFNDITIKFPYPEFYVAQEEQQKNTAEMLEDAKNGKPHLKSVKHIYVKCMVRDTYQLTHTSLKNAADAYNLKTHKGSCPYKAVNEYFSTNTFYKDESSFPDLRYWKDENEYKEQKEIWKSKNMLTYDITEELISYCMQDVQVTVELTKKLLETFNTFIKEEFNLQCNFNIFKRPTISSNSHAIFRQLHFKAHGIKYNKLPKIVAPSDEMYTFIRQSVRGGRCYPTFLGVFKKNLYVYDICGMYASALTHPMPYGIPVGETERVQEIEKFNLLLQRTSKLSYFEDIKPMIVAIDALPPPPELLDVLPPLCSKKSGRLCWTNEPLHDEIVTSIDIITLHNRGWRVKILPNKMNTVFPEWNTCCSEYVKVNILAKEKATLEHNEVKRAISKLLSNALYGSFATRENNDITVFEQSISEKVKKQLNNNELKIENITTIPTNHLPCTTITDLKFMLKEKQDTDRSLDTDDELASPFTGLEFLDESVSEFKIARSTHSQTYKPFNILDVTSDNLTIYMLKSTNEHPSNKRYPTQLASFVLAWTRAFMSDWTEILYGDQYHIPIQNKSIRSIYGDTDSLFLTQEGHERMIKFGSHRLKTKNSKLIFNQNVPEITWAVECETWCDHCGKPACSTESIFLAPKLYALKSITCSTCKISKPGKLRAKGHCTTDITFEILNACFNYHNSSSNPEKKFTTARTAFKRTLCKSYGKFSAFSIHEIELIRELRPWNDPTLYFLSDCTMIPYDMYHPNPRVTPLFLTQEFEDDG
ncbi:DNA polymerase [unidentified adenovirus]|uniref:DNA polymerase n=1 Tax=Chinstrap penguin adenovirus 2 TaxID=1434088 RepID=A0A162HSG6_9ADEN|nr:DNA polymerase [Chinstrap penguin adenovirus 2]ALB78138.1 DNA polymerase [Chinstrap penguin adenovirus 2]ALB78160.1 DNA polymerase [unidentified adenovirus]